METKSTEWYTLPVYIEAARQAMGSIELDPASCADANKIVKAERYYTQEQNGLLQEWRAESVWLNPPFTRGLIPAFTEKLLCEYQRGNVSQAIMLATTEVNAKWFQPLRQFLICFPDHRVKFIVPGRRLNKYTQMFGTSFVYMGFNRQKFIEVFSQFGDIMERVNAPKARMTTRKLWGDVA